MISQSVKSQSQQIFANIEILFKSISENDFNMVKGGFVVWKHFYHMIHSIDKHFINPELFIEPLFHIKNLDIINYENDTHLTKEQLLVYYEQVRIRTLNYLNNLTENILNETIVFKNMTVTKLELILAQLRHVFYHIGYLHCCIKIEKGETPEYVGLYKVVSEK